MRNDAVLRVVGVQSIALASLAAAAETPPARFFDNPSEYAFFPLVIAFSFVGALARLLRTWELSMPWQQRVGWLLSGTFAGCLFALAGWGRVPPSINLFLAGLASYWADVALVYLAQRQFQAAQLKARPLSEVPHDE